MSDNTQASDREHMGDRAHRGDKTHGGDRAHMEQPVLVERVLYALLGPAAGVCLEFGVPLKQVVELAQTACFHEARRRGLTTAQAAERLGVSERKVAQLSRRLKHSFLPEEAEVALPRRIEFMLWAEPLSAARLAQVLGEPVDAVATAIESLLAQGRIRPEPGRIARFAVVRSEFRLVDKRGWLSRLDGLRNLLGSVGRAVSGRFFEAEERAFARTLSLRVPAGGQARLRALYEETIFVALAALDEEARGDPEAELMDVSIVWAPGEASTTQKPREK